MDAADADFGNVQLFDPTSQALRIAAHSGFQDEFLSYFEHVTIEHTSVCGRAFEHKARVVVPSVGSDDFFGSDEVRCALLQAQVEAVQSTPLFAPSGAFLGMLSTHYRRPNPLSNGILDRLDRVVENFVASL
jgi:GAF domain-containing protein